jgi:hypothetical protein
MYMDRHTDRHVEPNITYYGKRPLGRSRNWSKDNIVTDLINALQSNSSVNMVQHATIDEVVFSVSSAPSPVLVTDK